MSDAASAAAGLAAAAEALRQGRLIGLPTETVYGLGADARDDHAVAAIYAAKGRPSFNPLIVHFADLDALKAMVEWSEEAEAIAQSFWPGPLTLVLPLREGARVSKLVTAGLDTIAVRMPAAPVARDLLRAAGVPVAAPSANVSGQISPTRAEHVAASLGDRVDAILDGGPCKVGLESTILGLAGRPTLLRPGGITREALSHVLGRRIAERRRAHAGENNAGSVEWPNRRARPTRRTRPNWPRTSPRSPSRASGSWPSS